MGKASQCLSFKKHSIFFPILLQWRQYLPGNAMRQLRGQQTGILLDGVHVNGISPCVVQCAFFFLSNNAAIRQPPPESTYTVKFHSICHCDVHLTNIYHTVVQCSELHTNILLFYSAVLTVLYIQRMQNFSMHRTPG